MSGSSLDGLDIVYAEFQEAAGRWSFDIIAADCYAYDDAWHERLKNATMLSAFEYQLLHAQYGHYIGRQVNAFINAHNLHYKVALIASHGHTTFHMPAQQLTAQLGDGAAIAAETHLPVISDLRALDVAFGGQGAPIVPIGEKLLFADYDMLLNIGGIANISVQTPNGYIAFDICPANRVLNMLANKLGRPYDAEGQLAALGNVNADLLQKLNTLGYYDLPYPKSLANSFGTDEVYPLIRSFGLPHNDELRTYVEHIAVQVRSAIAQTELLNATEADKILKLLITGGGAFNTFLVQRIKEELLPLKVEVILPDEKIIKYKEALIMALIGVLRWRQEYTVLSSVTGARRDSIGGALWIGQEA